MENNHTLTAKQNQLIAAYMSGEAVSAELLKECREHPEVMQELTRLTRTERLIEMALKPEQNSQFINNVMERIALEKPSSESIANKVINVVDHKRSPKNWFFKPQAMAASIVMFMGLFMLSNFMLINSDIAVITKTAATPYSQKSLNVGNRIRRGKIKLEQGYTEIELSNGVVLVLEAPIELDIRSADQVILTKGKLVARVPEQAIGFRIDTPSAEIIDLGTEFGVDVQENGESQVHVLDGEVKARANNLQTYKHIKKDEALAFNLADEMLVIKSESSEFMRVLPGKSAQNPDYLHWSFDTQSGSAYLSDGTGINGQQYTAIDKTPEHKPKITQSAGQFGRSVYFDGQANWLQTSFPGIGQDAPRTVAFWLKVPTDFSVDNAYGILSWGLQQNYAAWQVSPNPEPVNGPLGRIRIGTYNAQVVGSTDLRDDEWHHIAIVLYGGETSDISTHVLLYVDGLLEKTHNKSIAKVNTQLNHPQSKPLSMGRNLGFNKDATHEKQKYFKGGLDEVFIFEAALEQQQIQQLMKNNKLIE
ncbi:LamG-like jellyroll fold domain-containing protein [Algibacillus agarilyticus]|uniref:LamG-like jellyroll fold domain-containing protein n=1 Tax=Algibacillus agarilyticus TaxID=2234133 RepID=UPI000DD0E8AC|nr:LamG-like jellyroll fold domain-containing protein [Algibacillus agarilyticus]